MPRWSDPNPALRARILRVAHMNGGKVTAAQVAKTLDLTTKEAATRLVRLGFTRVHGPKADTYVLPEVVSQ